MAIRRPQRRAQETSLPVQIGGQQDVVEMHRKAIEGGGISPKRAAALVAATRRLAELQSKAERVLMPPATGRERVAGVWAANARGAPESRGGDQTLDQVFGNAPEALLAGHHPRGRRATTRRRRRAPIITRGSFRLYNAARCRSAAISVPRPSKLVFNSRALFKASSTWERIFSLPI
jgi:hypothetical protein